MDHGGLPRRVEGERVDLPISLWCLVAAFGTYFCMYGFRKPFTAAGFEGLELAGAPYKVVLVISQVLGYTLSKFWGIRVIAEMEPRRRAGMILLLIAAAEGALLLVGLTPPPFNFAWLFFNGLPLGMVFGLVLGFLEGRRQTEVLTAGLCVSFIVADGVVKSAGATVLAAGTPEFWMPFVTGLFFVPPLLLFVWMLSRIPAPDRIDVAARSERTPMDRADRTAFLRRHGRGLGLIALAYLLITVLRSVRADFAPEIWAGLQAVVPPETFGWSETAVAAGLLLLIGFGVFVRDNRRAFSVGMGLCVAGTLLIAAALLGLAAGFLSPFGFMVAHGVGLYLPYIVVHTTIFERLIAMTRDRANIGYLMYLVDAFGYLGYVIVLLARSFTGPSWAFLPFFVGLSWVVAVASALLLVPAWRLLARQAAARGAAASPDAARPDPEPGASSRN